MPAPPHSLHRWRRLPCSQIPLPPQSLHVRRCRPCGHLRDLPMWIARGERDQWDLARIFFRNKWGCSRSTVTLLIYYSYCTLLYLFVYFILYSIYFYNSPTHPIARLPPPPGPRPLAPAGRLLRLAPRLSPAPVDSPVSPSSDPHANRSVSLSLRRPTRGSLRLERDLARPCAKRAALRHEGSVLFFEARVLLLRDVPAAH